MNRFDFRATRCTTLPIHIWPCPAGSLNSSTTTSSPPFPTSPRTPSTRSGWRRTRRSAQAHLLLRFRYLFNTYDFDYGVIKRDFGTWFLIDYHHTVATKLRHISLPTGQDATRGPEPAGQPSGGRVPRHFSEPQLGPARPLRGEHPLL